MSDWLEVDIGSTGIRFSCHKGKKEVDLFLPRPVEDLGSRLVEFINDNRLGSRPLMFFLREDLLFFKKFSLPLQTVNVKEAVHYQLSVLTPFAEDALYDFTVHRGRKDQEVALYAVKGDEVIPYLQQAAGENFRILGIYPASQRYVTGAIRNKGWGLLTGGNHPKLLSFDGSRLQDRSLWLRPPDWEKMDEAGLPEVIYQTEDLGHGERFRKAEELLSDPPLLKEYNLLPAEYKRPDYLRYGLIIFVILNVVVLLVLGGIKEYKIRERLSSLQTAVEKVEPQVEQLQRLRAREKELNAAIKQIENVEIKFDLIRFFEGLTVALPQDSYLDRIRIEGLKNKAIHLQGYTDDISQLTTRLGDLGDVQLRSTRQRQDKIYFHVELDVL